MCEMTRIWIFAVFVIGLWNGVSEASTCTSRGRFPNENEPDCRGFTMCVFAAPGMYSQLDLTCPGNFVYSHIDNQCTNITSYQCFPQHNCTSQGLFASDRDQNCTSYIACVQGLNNFATARLIQCPEDTLFSPIEGACVNTTVFTCENDLPNVLDALPSQETNNTNTNNGVNLCFKYALLVSLMFGLVV